MSARSHNWRLGAIDRASTTEQVLQELRDAIVDGRIAQGDALREVPLSRSLGTGRSAAREAIEAGVARLAVEASPSPDLSSLRTALEDLRTRARGHDRITDDLIEADIRFHEELVRLAGSPRLRRAHET